MLDRLRARLRGAGGAAPPAPDRPGIPPAAPPGPAPFDPAASEADVRACFRLLLGRDPNPEEWRGHAQRAGEPLAGLVAGYLASLEFARRGLLARDPARSVELVEGPGFAVAVDPADPDVGRHVRAGAYEPDVTAVFRRHLRPGMAVLDVGANVGWFTMLSAHLVGPAGHVLAVEPNPRNARLIEAGRRRNGYGHVTVAQVAAGRETGLLVLHADRSNGTTSAIADDLDSLLAAETVPCLRLDDLADPSRAYAFVKLDVEGAEYNALRGAEGLLARDRPVLVSELSPDLMPGISGVTGEEYLRWLAARGYAFGVVRPDGSVAPPGTDPAPVLAEYRGRGTDHVDVVATPA